jgi:hypothetical protein
VKIVELWAYQRVWDKKIAALDTGLVWRGMFFIKTGGILFLKMRGKRRYIFFIGRGLSGILAGDFNYWRPKFTVYAISKGRKFCIYVGDTWNCDNKLGGQVTGITGPP